MFSDVVKVFLVMVAAHGVFADSTWTAGQANCTLKNGFNNMFCGTGNMSVCCKTNETCIGPVTMYGGAQKYACSADRTLSGTKALKIILIPLICMIMDIGFIVYMVLKLDAKGSLVTRLGIMLIALSWPLFLSTQWIFGCWSAFLALFVAYVNNSTGLPWWMPRLTWAIQLFFLILLLGPNEAFNAPLFSQSTGSKSQLIATALNMKESTCDKHYEKFFKILQVEKDAKMADPNKGIYGLCTIEWLGFVQVMVIFEGILLMVMVVFTAKNFLYADKGSDTSKVWDVPSPPTTAQGA